MPMLRSMPIGVVKLVGRLLGELKFVAVVTGLLAVTFASPLLATTFPGAGLDDFATTGAFKVLLLDGTEITFSGDDPHTIIGRSDPFAESAEPPAGAPIFNGGAAPYPNTSPLAPDPMRFPDDFPDDHSLSPRREVHTEILSLVLTGPSGVLRAGQPFYDSLTALGHPSYFYRDSFGEVASNDAAGTPSMDFPARSFFDVFVQVELEFNAQTFYLYNRNPLVVEADITQFPPNFVAPQDQYIHDPDFPSVALYDNNRILRGFLISAGHGSPDVEQLIEEEENQSDPLYAPVPGGMQGPLTFSVDNQSQGLPANSGAPSFTPISPQNHVRDDAGMDTQQVTAYEHVPAMENKRVPRLTGTVGAAAPDFVSGDAINSMTYGRDGTLSPPRVPMAGTLFFSVDRATVGAAGSDVQTAASGTPPSQAASVFSASVPGFSLYFDLPAPIVPPGSNYLAADATQLGLRPMEGSADQDNVTGIEMTQFDPGTHVFYGTFSGPSFDATNGQQGTIYIYDPNVPVNGDFESGNLSVFAGPTSMGLFAGNPSTQAGDVIDALALADTSNLGTLDAGIDSLLFSLAPGSPSLSQLGLSPADILISFFDNTLPMSYGDPQLGTFDVFATAASIGLLATDDVDAIDIRPAKMGMSPGVPGDFNEDGTDDAADYVVWRKIGSNSLPNDGGAATAADRYDLWRTHFAETNGNSSPSDPAVPEPASMVSTLLLVGILLTCARRRWVRLACQCLP